MCPWPLFSPGLHPVKSPVQKVTALIFIVSFKFSRPFALCTDHGEWTFEGPSLQGIKNPLNDPNLKLPRLSVSVA